MNAKQALMRLFIALPVRQTPALNAILDRLAQMSGAIRPVRPEQLHLTLKFLGDVPPDRLRDIRDALDETARKIKPFAWSIQGRGAFPHAGRPRVIWAGCVPADPIVRLAGLIEDRLAAKRFERDRYGFHPHLTLARVRGHAPNLAAFLKESDSSILAEESAENIILYRSLLEKKFAMHQPIHEATLTGS